MASQEMHITELLRWIEMNLHENLSIERVAERSGYSKRHLQRIFKDCTGYNLIEYIRARRLCKIALELKLTNKSLVEIVNAYHFSSLSSLTRTFTSFYGIPPTRYKEVNGLKLGEFVSLHTISKQSRMTSFEFISIDHLILYGICGHYHCPVSQLKMPHRSYRKDKRKDFISHNNLINKNIYSLGRFQPYNSDTFSCEFYIGCEQKINSMLPLPVITGDFLKFSFEGHEDEIYEFVMSVYFNNLNNYNFKRRNYFDVEHFIYLNDHTVQYSYYIPIHFDHRSLMDLTNTYNI